VNLIGSYNYAVVALSVLIAIVASYAALDLAGRVTAARGRIRAVWLLGGAIAMGTGIWSMHYMGGTVWATQNGDKGATIQFTLPIGSWTES
jgi:NO-binding membrane sensor protein with MHYT domain